MLKRKFLNLSLVSLIISAVSFIINYFFYHFVTDAGITTTFQSEAGKPFVTLLIGIFATLFLFLCVASLAIAFIFGDKK
ncbi:MAG: hypothetical protein IKA64_01630 [Clostridia bacterium]|nr:hypothetical protein [Clostridia bacterium]